MELHLPDLPEVPIALGRSLQALPRTLPWHLRLRAAAATWLPLLLMAVLALATWWLVKHAPRAPAAAAAAALSAEPDYTMQGFEIERFDAAGRLKLRIEGRSLRHFPADDRIEIDAAVIRAFAPDGRLTLARARQAVGKADGSDLQLRGSAEVSSQRSSGDTLVMRSEFLHAFLVAERVVSPAPVWVTMGRGGRDEIRASGLDYDHAAARLELKGPLRATLAPPPR